MGFIQKILKKIFKSRNKPSETAAEALRVDFQRRYHHFKLLLNANHKSLEIMAEIEQAWERGDYVFVRQGLKRHAEETGTALAQYRYGRVLAEGRADFVALGRQFLLQPRLERRPLLAECGLGGGQDVELTQELLVLGA